MKNLTVCMLLLLAAIFSSCAKPEVEWPKQDVEAMPAARWWWLGSAVDKENLTKNMEEYSKKGLRTLEITPIYGVQGNDANDIEFLSPKWMEMLRHIQSEAIRLGMQIDMNTGTGWPFGGPEVQIEDAACRLLIEEYTLKTGQSLQQSVQVTDVRQQPYAKLERFMAYSVDGKQVLDLTDKVVDGKLQWEAPEGDWRLIAAFCGKTLQKVKRAAPGGVGYVMNHFSARAVENYLDRFDRAFADGTPLPHNFFNDSYEVYQADWSEGLFDEFEARRGYKLEEYLPQFLTQENRTDEVGRIVSDYRETLGDLLLENFTRKWTAWANGHGSKTRNQAHGSPGNLIDLYATVDIPECEGFGLSNFGIKGLRQDSLTRKNDSDISMLKYASSGAHIAGKKFTSSETFTWLTEHFRTSLSQCKPDLDLMFLSGVNHTYFHGTTYSPQEAAWPGWKFYASVDMSPTNSIWRDASAFFQYITRCQSFLQMGQPDNDFLLYLPVYDMWQEQPGRLLMFDIHSMARRAPRFIKAVNRIISAGYDVDYISDNFIRTASCKDNLLKTVGGTEYKALLVPGAKLMPADVLQKLYELAKQGATIVFLDRYPEDVPGYGEKKAEREMFMQALEGLKSLPNVCFGTDYAETLAKTEVKPEVMKAEMGLSCIRRTNESGHHYFISALTDKDTEAWVPLAVEAQSAMFFNPMDGSSGKALVRTQNGQTEVYLQLRSGESIILKTFAEANVDVPAWKYRQEGKENMILDKWAFRFVEATPAVANVPDSVTSGTWTALDFEGATTTMGTACYTTTIHLDNPAQADNYQLSLGDVRESARIRINGQEVATLWAVPYTCMVGPYLRQGENTIEIEVTNLPANRIADMDRNGIVWRIYKEINLVDLNYKKTGYGHWEPVYSGLLGPINLTSIIMK
ncbi:MAG: glycosyl hydrolase family 2 [Mediterranea massiliensis]|nr:glycosyl hydrolase family 2 [Mediterranea massiliensis]